MDTIKNGETRDQHLRNSNPCQVDLPNHGNPNRPRGIANRETEIRVVGSLILTFLHVVYDLCQTGQHVIREGLRLRVYEHDSQDKISERSDAPSIVST